MKKKAQNCHYHLLYNDAINKKNDENHKARHKLTLLPCEAAWRNSLCACRKSWEKCTIVSFRKLQNGCNYLHGRDYTFFNFFFDGSGKDVEQPAERPAERQGLGEPFSRTKCRGLGNVSSISSAWYRLF